jgi:malate dehydrogenase (oxaloacetate-decarboxylating)
MARLSRYFENVRNAQGVERLRVFTDGAALLRLPLTNKGTAFPLQERIDLGLDGLLPPHVTTLDEQLERVYAAYSREPTALAKHSYLRGLQERNEILYYALLSRHIEEMLPIVYTPTVGEAVQRFHALYQGARGLSLSPVNIDRAREVSHNCILDDVRIIVATDSSAILGIGDQGYGGLAIAIGKLALYTVAAGVSPFRSLPLGLDVGTDRKDLVDNPAYLGVRQTRLKGDEYLAFMDKVVDSIAARWPRAILQWEDLSKDTAFDVLERYRHKLPSFNDDIQGTGAVALAGLIAASKVRGRALTSERVVVYGAGAGGAGVALAIKTGMMRAGLTEPQARERVLVLDSKGLLVEGRKMEPYKEELAQRKDVVAAWGVTGSGDNLDLLATLQHSKATALLGLSGQPGTFRQEHVEAMLHEERPVVFALSNPTTSCEATPEDMLKWSKGRALVATGSPFAPVDVNGTLVPIGQGNNAFIFPGLGFGAILADAKEITDNMVAASAEALAEYTQEHHVAAGLIYPPVSELREVSVRVATKVLRQAFADGVARTTKTTPEQAEAYVRSKAWKAGYLPFSRQ